MEQERRDFIEYATKYNDIFYTDRSGYWARGFKHTAKGWLVYEEHDERNSPDVPEGAEEAIVLFKSNQHDALPKHWFALTKDTASKAFDRLKERVGVDIKGNINDYDATDEDVAIQQALLGEVVYG